MGQYCSKGLRNRVFFARIYDKPETTARGMTNVLDYVFLQHKEKEGENNFTIRIWKNTRGGGNELNADENRYCNMWGHGDGKSYFVWIAPGGTMRGWKNHKPNPTSAADVRCKNKKNGLDINDLAVRFADLTGNGRDDYLCLSPNGSANAWIHDDDNS
ncbi:hypothetical protein ACHAP5_011184 [Fusarium lateritium]